MKRLANVYFLSSAIYIFLIPLFSQVSIIPPLSGELEHPINPATGLRMCYGLCIAYKRSRSAAGEPIAHHQTP